MDFIRCHFKCNSELVEQFFHHKRVHVSTTGTILWWEKCSTIQSCNFPKWLFRKIHTLVLLPNLYTVNYHQAITQVCNNEGQVSNPDDSDSSKRNPKFKSEVRIQLDSNSVLSAPSGVYATVQFHLRLLESFRGWINYSYQYNLWFVFSNPTFW